MLSNPIHAYCIFQRLSNTYADFLLIKTQIARRTKSLTQYISSPQWYIPRSNPLYTESQIFLFKYIPGWEYFYRLSIAYAWEKEAYKLKAGSGPAKVRSFVESFLLQHLKATAPAKYHEQLTPHYPVSSTPKQRWNQTLAGRSVLTLQCPTS